MPSTRPLSTLTAHSSDHPSRVRRLWLAGMGLSVVSGLLSAAAMLNPGLHVLGWAALAPLLLAANTRDHKEPIFVLALPCGLIWSAAVHSWYPAVLGPWGYLLIAGVGAWYASLIDWGVRVQRRMPGAAQLLALPLLWAALEFIKFVTPVVRDWWFVPLAHSQWQFPPALQILSVTGFPGLSFLLMLANVALALLLQRWWHERRPDWAAIAGLAVVAAAVGWGALRIPAPPAGTFAIAATVDLANQADDIRRHSGAYGEVEGPYADTPAMSQALFDVNAALTRSVAPQQPAFVVWPENEFADADDPRFVDQLGALARETGAYIVADMVWRAPTGMHDTALLVAPAGHEAGRRAKIHLVSGETAYGFAPGPREFPVFATPYGNVGVGVCYDYHFLDVVRNLARSGAALLLMPTDDDFSRNRAFPPLHAADAVFRAVEHRVAFATSGTNGVSIIVDPYGRIAASSGVNERTVVVGHVFAAPGGTIYTRLGDWFGWLSAAGLAAMLAAAARRT